MAEGKVSTLTLDVRQGEIVSLMDVRPGDRIALAGTVFLELVQKSGRVARIRVTAPREVEIKKESLDACDFRGKHAPITHS